MNRPQPLSARKRLIARTNGAKSRGPVTAAGKARSAQNALKHGLLSTGAMLPTEDADAFHALNHDLTLELQPATASELILARSFAMCAVRLNRLWDLEAIAQRAELAKIPDVPGAEGTLAAWRSLHANDPSFPLYRRYEVTLTRELHRSHRHFMELRALRPENRPKTPEPNEPIKDLTPGDPAASVPLPASGPPVGPPRPLAALIALLVALGLLIFSSPATVHASSAPAPGCYDGPGSPPHMFFDQHSDLLNKALEAIHTRGYWSPFPESPSPRVYGETAAADGKAAFDAMLNNRFDLDFPGASGTIGNEVSPFGISLNVAYPKVDVDALIAGMEKASEAWRAAGPKAWVGVSLEALNRINKHSFQIAHAVMHTTGQAFVMAFQAGGPHAQDRALEAIAYAWEEMSHVPAEAYWEKPQGKNDPLKMRKKFRIVPRGIGLVIGCATFPTWNGYPGLFASLATGNAVIVKPHPAAVLPLAITVKIIRDVLQEAGFDPNVVTLVVHELTDKVAQDLSVRPEVKIIDFTGSSANGNWIETHARQAQVFTEKAGVNQIVVDSAADFKGMVRNIAFSLSLYSGQMCTAPQNIYVPKDGIATPEGHLSFDQVAEAIGASVSKLVSEPEKAVEFLGAVQSTATLDRINEARGLGQVVQDSKQLTHPTFPDARIHTPLIVKVDAADESKFSHEHFGPIAFVIATSGTPQSLELAGRIAKKSGAMTMSVYSSSDDVLRQAEDVAADAGVPLSENLTGGIFVNQSAAFSDYHGTGANPAANASLTDAAFVASRFRIAQSRAHV